MKKAELSRQFIEAMLRLKRDTITQTNLGCLPILGLVLFLNNNIEISYDIESGCWIFSDKSEEIYDNKWNPTLSQVTNLLDEFPEKDVLSSIKILYEKININYSEVNAVSLFKKYDEVLSTLIFDENHDIEGLSLKLEYEDNSYLIYWNPFENMIQFDEKGKEGYQELTPQKMIKILSKISYLEAFTKLSAFYSKLKRKK